MTLLAIKLLTLVVPTQNLKGRSNSRVNRCEVDRFVYLLINVNIECFYIFRSIVY